MRQGLDKSSAETSTDGSLLLGTQKPRDKQIASGCGSKARLPLKALHTVGYKRH